MRAEIFWIPAPTKGRIAVMPRPRGGDWLEEEMASLRREGVDVLASLLTLDEVEEFDLTEEARWCEASGMEFLSFQIADRDVLPQTQETLEFIRALASAVQSGKGVAVHCRQGIGRSALIAGSVLVSLGDTPAAAFERISKARGREVPETEQQRIWVERFARAREAVR